jgi:hypothetical protein
VSLPDPSTGSLVAVNAISSSLSDSNSSECACGGRSLRFFEVAPPSSCALCHASSQCLSKSQFSARSLLTRSNSVLKRTILLPIVSHWSYHIWFLPWYTPKVRLIEITLSYSALLHYQALLCGLKIDPTTAWNCFLTVAVQMPRRLSCIGILALTTRGLFQLLQVVVYPILSSWLHKAQNVQKIPCMLLDSFCPPRTPSMKMRVWWLSVYQFLWFFQRLAWNQYAIAKWTHS